MPSYWIESKTQKNKNANKKLKAVEKILSERIGRAQNVNFYQEKEPK